MELNFRPNDSPFVLRPYQREAIDATLAAIRDGIRRPLVVIATGGGKTVVFSEVPKWVAPKKTLVLAHREELIDQGASKLQQANPGHTVEIEQASRWATQDADVVVASVPTLGLDGSRRIERFDPREFGAVVVDEAHHATADSYQRIFEYFGAGEEGGPFLLGVTATPNRGDGTPLGDVFDSIVYQKSMLDLIREGWLCDVRAFTVATDVSINHVHTKAGEFVSSELSEAVNTDLRNLMIVRSWKELAEGRTRTLVFAVDVAHAHELAITFQSSGVEAEVVSGMTDRGMRRAILERFARGVTPVLTNCAVLTEGYDNPAIDCIVMARPTKSPLLFAQCIGRGTRTSPDKKDVLILDFVDNAGRHKITTVASLFDMPTGLKMRAEKITDVVEKVARFQAEFPGFDMSSGTFSLDELEKQKKWLKDLEAKAAIETKATEVDIFVRGEIDNTVKEHSTLSWVKYGQNGYQLGVNHDVFLRVEQDLIGKYALTKTEWNGSSRSTERINEYGSLGEAFAAGDKFVSDVFPDVIKLKDQNAKWRKDGATDSQIGLLQKLRIPFKEGVTKGEASNMIDAYFASKGGGRRHGGRRAVS